MEQSIMDLLKSLKNQTEIPEKKIIIYIHQVQNQGYFMDLVKLSRIWRMEFQLFVQFSLQQAHPLIS